MGNQASAKVTRIGLVEDWESNWAPNVEQDRDILFMEDKARTLIKSFLIKKNIIAGRILFYNFDKEDEGLVLINCFSISPIVKKKEETKKPQKKKSFRVKKFRNRKTQDKKFHKGKKHFQKGKSWKKKRKARNKKKYTRLYTRIIKSLKKFTKGNKEVSPAAKSFESLSRKHYDTLGVEEIAINLAKDAATQRSQAFYLNHTAVYLRRLEQDVHRFLKKTYCKERYWEKPSSEVISIYKKGNKNLFLRNFYRAVSKISTVSQLEQLDEVQTVVINNSLAKWNGWWSTNKDKLNSKNRKDRRIRQFRNRYRFQSQFFNPGVSKKKKGFKPFKKSAYRTWTESLKGNHFELELAARKANSTLWPYVDTKDLENPNDARTTIRQQRRPLSDIFLNILGSSDLHKGAWQEIYPQLLKSKQQRDLLKRPKRRASLKNPKWRKLLYSNTFANKVSQQGPSTQFIFESLEQNLIDGLKKEFGWKRLRLVFQDMNNRGTKSQTKIREALGHLFRHQRNPFFKDCLKLAAATWSYDWRQADLWANFISHILNETSPNRYRSVLSLVEDVITYFYNTDPRLAGFRIDYKGRFSGAPRARGHTLLRVGRIPRQTLRNPVSYAQSRLTTRYGAVSVKVWIFARPNNKRDK